MSRKSRTYMSRREREIMDIVYQAGEVSAADVEKRMSDDVSYDSVRVLLGILTKKGYLKRHRDQRRYIYSPAISRERAARFALDGVMRTFFAGSPSRAILTLLDMSSADISEEEFERIASWIEKEKEE